MFLKFETNLRVIGSLATESGLHVAGFYTHLVELKQGKTIFEFIRPFEVRFIPT